jgi:hypothetical protein
VPFFATSSSVLSWHWAMDSTVKGMDVSHVKKNKIGCGGKARTHNKPYDADIQYTHIVFTNSKRAGAFGEIFTVIV